MLTRICRLKALTDGIRSPDRYVPFLIISPILAEISA